LQKNVLFRAFSYEFGALPPPSVGDAHAASVRRGQVVEGEVHGGRQVHRVAKGSRARDHKDGSGTSVPGELSYC
jgi:hypothetical protein